MEPNPLKTEDEVDEAFTVSALPLYSICSNYSVEKNIFTVKQAHCEMYCRGCLAILRPSLSPSIYFKPTASLKLQLWPTQNLNTAWIISIASSPLHPLQAQYYLMK